MLPASDLGGILMGREQGGRYVAVSVMAKALETRCGPHGATLPTHTILCLREASKVWALCLSFE